MADKFNAFARFVNDFVSSPTALIVALLTVLTWAISGPLFKFSDGWQLVINTGTTIVTFLMVFVLNNAQSRNTDAINTKLDAIILAIADADNKIVGVERKTEQEARTLRDNIQAAVDAAE